MKTWLAGFKKFINRGNIIDLATGVVIGGAFGKIVNSLVNDIIFPLLAAILGKAEFKDLAWKIYLRTDIDPTTLEATKIYSTVRYGNTIQMIFEFLIIALVIYIVVIRLLKGEAKRQREFEKEQARLEAEAIANPKPVEPPKPVEVILPADIKVIN